MVGGFFVWAADLGHADALAIRLAAATMGGEDDGGVTGKLAGFVGTGDREVIKSVKVVGTDLMADGKSEAQVQVTLGSSASGTVAFSSLGGSLTPASVRVPQGGGTVSATFRSGFRPGTYAILVQVCRPSMTANGAGGAGGGWGSCTRSTGASVRISATPAQLAQAVELRKQAEAKRAEAATVAQSIAALDDQIKPLKDQADQQSAKAAAKRDEAKRLRDAAAQLSSTANPQQRAKSLAADLRKGADNLSALRTKALAGSGDNRDLVDQQLSDAKVTQMSRDIKAVADSLEQAKDAATVGQAVTRYRTAAVEPITSMRKALDQAVAPVKEQLAALQKEINAKQAEIDKANAEKAYWLKEANDAANRYNSSCRKVWFATVCTDMGAFGYYVQAQAQAVAADGRATGAAAQAAAKIVVQVKIRSYVAIGEVLASAMDDSIASYVQAAANLEQLYQQYQGLLSQLQQANQMSQDAAKADGQAVDLQKLADELMKQIAPKTTERSALDQQRQTLLNDAQKLEQQAAALGG